MKPHLRDLFWLILLAAIVTIWWFDRAELVARLSADETPLRSAVVPLAPAWPAAAPSNDPSRAERLLRESKALQELQRAWEREWFDAPSHLQGEVHRGVI